MDQKMEIMIYAILSNNRDSKKLDSRLNGMKGISDTALYAVTEGEISAVVSDVIKADLIADSRNAIAYAKVIEALAQQFTLLPMRFGSAMESAIPVIKMLERNYANIHQNLLKVRNKYEFGLKIFCDSDKLTSELTVKSNINITTVSNSDPEIKYSVYREWVNNKLQIHRLEELKLAYVDSVIAEITTYLDRIKANCKFKKMATPNNIIDALFLLEKEKKNELIKTVEDLQLRYPGLNFILTGPWPPYNFVETTIK